MFRSISVCLLWCFMPWTATVELNSSNNNNSAVAGNPATVNFYIYNCHNNQPSSHYTLHTCTLYLYFLLDFLFVDEWHWADPVKLGHSTGTVVRLADVSFPPGSPVESCADYYILLLAVEGSLPLLIVCSAGCCCCCWWNSRERWVRHWTRQCPITCRNTGSIQLDGRCQHVVDYWWLHVRNGSSAERT